MILQNTIAILSAASRWCVPDLSEYQGKSKSFVKERALQNHVRLLQEQRSHFLKSTSDRTSIYESHSRQTAIAAFDAGRWDFASLS